MARNSIYNLLIYKLYDQELERVASRYISYRMLDIGCGSKPYVHMIQPFIF
jgi:hypothetical protein